MTFHGRSSRWAAALALGLAGLVGVGAATVLAAPADRTAASAFELTLEGALAGTPADVTSQGTFRSQAPFCSTGTFVDLGPIGHGNVNGKRRFTCDDGTGSVTVAIAQMEYYPPFCGPSDSVRPSICTTWRILEGSGSYARLRGNGSLRAELLSDWGFATWRSTLEGDVDFDAVAPSVRISKATVTKLRRPAGTYSTRVALALRDNVTDSPVSYTLRVTSGRRELARRFGTAKTRAVPMTLRIRPPAGARTVQLQLTGVDPIGNATSVRRVLRLPR
jgi:hypothetical protein